MIEELNRKEIERAVREGATTVKLEVCEDCTLTRQILQAFASKVQVILLHIEGAEVAIVKKPRTE